MAKAQADWLRQFLALPHGIPSPDTFRRVVSRLKPEELTRCFINWTDSLRESIAGEVVAIDGKTLRRSPDQVRGRLFDRAADKGAIHIGSTQEPALNLIQGRWQIE